MVEVEVAVHDDVYVARREAQLAEGVRDPDALWPVPGLGLWACFTEAGIEQEQAGGGACDVAEHGLDTRASRVRLLRRANECPQVETCHVVDPHVPPP